MLTWLAKRVIQWLIEEHEIDGVAPCDFARLTEEIRPSDVLLVEGRTRVSDVIKSITQSSWTHSAIYIGRLNEIQDEAVHASVRHHYSGDPNTQLLIEALLGHGTVVTPLAKYQRDHLRICRPRGLSPEDAHKIIEYSAQHLGIDYDVRQMLDLARLLFPYGILPRRWRSSLFQHHIGMPTRTVCSSMIAAAFASVRFPVLPVIHRDDDGTLRLYPRNHKLYTPRDFDYSPYFDIIKYPLLGLDDLGVYRMLPWDQDGVICNDKNECYVPRFKESRKPVAARSVTGPATHVEQPPLSVVARE